MKEHYLNQINQPENQSNERKETIRSDYFRAFENHLDNYLNEPHWLKNEQVAEVVMNSLLFRNNQHYTLWAACIMSNHVHILLSTKPGSPLLNVILQNHKKFTAVGSNKILSRSGKFWEEESYDTLIRNNQHFYNSATYIIQNPVKAGLVKDWSHWKWTYLDPKLKDIGTLYR